MRIPPLTTLIQKRGYQLNTTQKEALDKRSVTIPVPVLLREQVKLATARLNMSMSKYIERAVRDTLEGRAGF